MPIPEAPLTWEITVPLLSNRSIVGAWTRAMLITGLLVGGLLSFVFVMQEEWDALGVTWLGVAILTGAFYLFGLLVMALVFRNRMRFRYTIDRDGILMETIDSRAKTANRAAMVGGVLLGSGQTTGAGLLAASQETQRVEWEGGFMAQLRPRQHVVVLRNGWRQLMVVYCTPETYAPAAERIAAAMQGRGTAARTRPSRLGRTLAWSVAVVVACVPVFALARELDVTLLLPLLLLCFALATVWLLSLLGWVVLGVIVSIAAAVAISAFEVRDSLFAPGQTYAHWTVFSGDDWALIAVAATGMALLAWVAVRGLLGKRRSLLESDWEDMG